MKDEEWDQNFKNNYLADRKGFTFNELKEDIRELLTLGEQKDHIEPEDLAEYLSKDSSSLKSVLTVAGISDEFFKRVVSLLRYEGNGSDWQEGRSDNEWSLNQIRSKIQEDKEFRLDIASVFLDGKDNEVLDEYLPGWELSKFSRKNLLFETEGVVDRIAKQSLKGTRDAKKGEIPEDRIERFLKDNDIPYDRGEYKLGLFDGDDEEDEPQFDFLIPNKQNPQIIVEVSFEMTTGSGMNRKIRDVSSARSEIHRQMDGAKVVAFVDGIGWLARGVSALESWASATDNMFTLEDNELNRFIELCDEVLEESE